MDRTQRKKRAEPVKAAESSGDEDASDEEIPVKGRYFAAETSAKKGRKQSVMDTDDNDDESAGEAEEPQRRSKKGGDKTKKRRRPRGDGDSDDDSVDGPTETGKAMAKYLRMAPDEKPTNIKSIKDKKVKSALKRTEKQFREAAYRAARAEILLPDEAGFLEADGMEKTYRYKQSEIRNHLDINTQAKVFNLKLDELGPYMMDYSRSGKYLLLGGRKGHLASVDWIQGTVEMEIQLRETVRDVKYLHNQTMLAVAQKKYVYIYDNQGVELHVLRNHREVNRLEFLPYHFLLASVGNAGYLKYQDTSTGALVAEWRTKLGRCDTMTQNKHNAVVLLGHNNGLVTMWSPTMSTPLIRMMSHKGPVRAMAVDPSGNYLATAGLDCQLKIWDLRTYQPLHAYHCHTPAASLDISGTGMLGAAFRSKVEVWKDALSTKQGAPYITHPTPASSAADIGFCPFEDILGVGHATGFSSLVVPGAGLANFDSFEANPFETKNQRRETEVHQLLEKLQPEMITLNPGVIANVDRAPAEVIAADRKLAEEANEARRGKKKPKHHARGRDKAGKREIKRQERHFLGARSKAASAAREAKNKAKKDAAPPEPSVLDRFKRSS